MKESASKREREREREHGLLSLVVNLVGKGILEVEATNHQLLGYRRQRRNKKRRRIVRRRKEEFEAKIRSLQKFLKTFH